MNVIFPSPYLVISYNKAAKELDIKIDGQEVRLSRIWLNNMPAEYLKSINTSGIHIVSRELWNIQRDSSDDFRLEYTDQSRRWHWWKGNGCQELKIFLDDNEDCFPSCLKILGLKKYIKIKFFSSANDSPYSGSKPFNLYRIFLQNLGTGEERELGDDQTLEECEIKSGDKITCDYMKKIDKSSSFLQRATRGSYHDFTELPRFMENMTKRGELVCKIERQVDENLGTGFLIGPDQIMTCAHVAKSSPRTAIFFNNEKRQGLTVNLVERLYYCPTPDKEEPNASKLDFAVFRFQVIPSDHPSDVEKQRKLQMLATEALGFFKEAANEQPYTGETRYANIIQHPGGQPKKIAFKQSLIIRSWDYEIHYETITEESTSGAPVIDDHGRLIGLHYATCTLIERRLIDHKEDLFIALRLGECKTEKDYATYYSFPESGLRFYLSGEYKGYCIWNEKKLALLELIYKIVKEDPQVWAVDFLKKKFNMDLTEHIQCNTAINIRRIYNKIYSDEDTRKRVFVDPVDRVNPVDSDRSKRYNFLIPIVVGLFGCIIFRAKISNCLRLLRFLGRK